MSQTRCFLIIMVASSDGASLGSLEIQRFLKKPVLAAWLLLGWAIVYVPFVHVAESSDANDANIVEVVGGGSDFSDGEVAAEIGR